MRIRHTVTPQQCRAVCTAVQKDEYSSLLERLIEVIVVRSRGRLLASPSEWDTTVVFIRVSHVTISGTKRDRVNVKREQKIEVPASETAIRFATESRPTVSPLFEVCQPSYRDESLHYYCEMGA